jgi:hypothetical protein
MLHDIAIPFTGTYTAEGRIYRPTRCRLNLLFVLVFARFYERHKRKREDKEWSPQKQSK